MTENGGMENVLAHLGKPQVIHSGYLLWSPGKKSYKM